MIYIYSKLGVAALRIGEGEPKKKSATKIESGENRTRSLRPFDGSGWLAPGLETPRYVTGVLPLHYALSFVDRTVLDGIYICFRFAISSIYSCSFFFNFLSTVPSPLFFLIPSACPQLSMKCSCCGAALLIREYARRTGSALDL